MNRYDNFGQSFYSKAQNSFLKLAKNKKIKNKIEPSIKKKKVVICDRFIDSTIAYQVYGKRVDKKFIDNIHKKILRGVKPNIVFILKVSNKSSSSRLRKRKTKNRYDNFAQSFYSKAQRSFIKIAKSKKNYFILDSSSNDRNLELKIFNIIKRYLNIQ